MSIIDRLLGVLAPYECLGCEAEGNLLCKACIQQLPGVPERCYRCLRLSAGALTCADCGAFSDICRLQAGAAYSGLAKDLVWKLKFGGVQAAARHMAARLTPLIADRISDRELTIVPVPTATSRVRSRGYDQAKLLARELSRRTGLPYVDCFARSGHSHQLGSSRRERLNQLDNAFRIGGRTRVRGMKVLLVDDVVTTGATLEAAARTLRRCGVARVEAITFARA